jgi:hypothetical protein
MHRRRKHPATAATIPNPQGFAARSENQNEDTTMKKWSVLILVIGEDGKTTHSAETEIGAPDQRSAIAYIGNGSVRIPAKPEDTVMLSAAPAPDDGEEAIYIVAVRPHWTSVLIALFAKREDTEADRQKFEARLAEETVWHHQYGPPHASRDPANDPRLRDPRFARWLPK